MRFKTILSLCFVILAANAIPAAAEFDPAVIPQWGISVERVLALDTPGELTEQNQYRLTYDLSGIDGNISRIDYDFTVEGELGAVMVWYKEQADKAEQLALFTALRDDLAAKYGPPQKDFDPAKDEPLFPDSNYMRHRYAVWDVQRTDTYLSVIEQAQSNAVYILFTGVDYFQHR